MFGKGNKLEKWKLETQLSLVIDNGRHFIIAKNNGKYYSYDKEVFNSWSRITDESEINELTENIVADDFGKWLKENLIEQSSENKQRFGLLKLKDSAVTIYSSQCYWDIGDENLPEWYVRIWFSNIPKDAEVTDNQYCYPSTDCVVGSLVYDLMTYCEHHPDTLSK